MALRDPPNVLLIMTDDQGCGDVAFTGNDRLQTPNLNRLAQDGTVVSSFYVAPVCAPTRASLMTGRYHQRTGVLGVIEGREFMVESEVTLAEVLKGAGYATALFGKWHLGENYPWVPRAQGFDEFIGFLDGSNPYFDQVLTRNGQPYPTEGYLTEVFTDEAIRFIEEHRDEPFFVYLPYNAPHGPLEVPDAYARPYADLPERTRKIYGMMAFVDENVGRLMRRLDALDLTEETLVLFLSDNGPLFSETRRHNCGFRGHKYTVYEGGMRVPLALRWPGHVPAGREVVRPAAHIDVLPTVLDYAGVPLPDSLIVDGRSLRPLLTTAPEEKRRVWPERTLFMSYPGEHTLSDQEPAPYPGGMSVTGRYKMVDGDALYDLNADRGESNNLAEEEPDLLSSLDAAYRAFWQDVSSERAPYPRVHVGHPEEDPARLTTHWAQLSGGLRWQFADDSTAYRTIGVHGDWISFWTGASAATWRLAFQADARYRVALRLRCQGAPPGDVRVLVRAAGHTTGRALPECTGQWTEQIVGTLRVPAGAHDLVLTVPEGVPNADLDVGEVIIERVN